MMLFTFYSDNNSAKLFRKIKMTYFWELKHYFFCHFCFVQITNFNMRTSMSFEFCFKPFPPPISYNKSTRIIFGVKNLIPRVREYFPVVIRLNWSRIYSSFPSAEGYHPHYWWEEHVHWDWLKQEILLFFEMKKSLFQKFCNLNFWNSRSLWNSWSLFRKQKHNTELKPTGAQLQYSYSNLVEIYFSSSSIVLLQPISPGYSFVLPHLKTAKTRQMSGAGKELDKKARFLGPVTCRLHTFVPWHNSFFSLFHQFCKCFSFFAVVFKYPCWLTHIRNQKSVSIELILSCPSHWNSSKIHVTKHIKNQIWED